MSEAKKKCAVCVSADPKKCIEKRWKAIGFTHRLPPNPKCTCKCHSKPKEDEDE